MPATDTPLQALCPQCGTCVPLVRDRWLQVHSEGSADYLFPCADRRCIGSFMPAQRPTPPTRIPGARKTRYAASPEGLA